MACIILLYRGEQPQTDHIEGIVTVKAKAEFLGHPATRPVVVARHFDPGLSGVNLDRRVTNWFAVSSSMFPPLLLCEIVCYTVGGWLRHTSSMIQTDRYKKRVLSL